MKKYNHCKLIVNLKLWHLRPYKKIENVFGLEYFEYGFLCFKLVIS